MSATKPKSLENFVLSVFGHLVLFVDWPILDEKPMDSDFICGFATLTSRLSGKSSARECQI